MGDFISHLNLSFKLKLKLDWMLKFDFKPKLRLTLVLNRVLFSIFTVLEWTLSFKPKAKFNLKDKLHLV